MSVSSEKSESFTLLPYKYLYGIELKDTEFTELTEKFENIYKGEVCMLNFNTFFKHLPKPDKPNYEAFEFRFLTTYENEDESNHLILIEHNPDRKTIRATFQTNENGGRGRLWLKRVNSDLTREDFECFYNLVRILQLMTGLAVVTHPKQNYPYFPRGM